LARKGATPIPEGGSRRSEWSSSATRGTGNSVRQEDNHLYVTFGVSVPDFVGRPKGLVEGQDRTLDTGMGEAAATRGRPEERLGSLSGAPFGQKVRTYTSRVEDRQLRKALRKAGYPTSEEFTVMASPGLPATRSYVESPYTGKPQYGTEGHYDPRLMAMHPAELNYPDMGPYDQGLYQDLYGSLGEMGGEGPMYLQGEFLSRQDIGRRVLLGAGSGAGYPRMEGIGPSRLWGRLNPETGERSPVGGVINSLAPEGYDWKMWGRDLERVYGTERRARGGWMGPDHGDADEKRLSMELKRYERYLKAGGKDVGMEGWREMGSPVSGREIDALKSWWRKAGERFALMRGFERGSAEDALQIGEWIARAPESFVMRYLRFGGPIGLLLLATYSRDAGLMPSLLQFGVDELSKKGRPLNLDWKRMSGTTYDMMSLERQHHRELGDEPLLLAEANGFHPRDSYYSSWEEIDRIRIQRGAQDYDTVGLSERAITWGY